MTYVYETLSTNQIADAFYQDYYASWNKNYEACQALAAYLEQYAEDMGEPLELDIVAVRCEYSLYSDIAEFNKDQVTDYEDMDALRDYAQVIRVDDESFITDYTGE